MADLVITTTNVLGIKPFTQTIAKAGEAINAGMSVYLNGDGLWYKAKASGNAQQAGNSGIGICLVNVLSANQPIVVLSSGKWNSGCGAEVNGAAYCVSANFGGIAPIADLTSGQFVTILGIGLNGNQIQSPTAAGPFASGITP